MRLTNLAASVVTIAMLGGCIEDELEVATIDLDYLTAKQALAIAEPYMSSDGTLMSSDAMLNTITVRDRRENVRRVERLIEQRDASPQNVSLHFQVVRATEAGGMDPELAKVGNALRELLRFEGYQLVSQAMVSVSERHVVEQSLSGGSFPLQLGVRINDIAGGSGSVDMQVDLRRAGYPSLLATNVVVPMGQTVVLGSAYPGTEGEALILTVRGEMGSTKLRTSSRRSRDEGDAAAASRAEFEAAEAAAQAAAIEELYAREKAKHDAAVAGHGVVESGISSTAKVGPGGRIGVVGPKMPSVDQGHIITPARRTPGPRPGSGSTPPPDGTR